MSYEMRKEHVHERLTPSERRTLIYEKEPVDTLADLWVKYPEGGHSGWYCLIKSEHALYGWDEDVNEWTELGQGLLKGKHDKCAGMLMRLLNPGAYSEKDGVIAGEVFIVPLAEGDYTFLESKYPRKRKTIIVDDMELGQVILIAEDGVWQKLLLPVYDFIQDALVSYQHHRGVVLNPPDEVVFNPEARANDYVYYRGEDDLCPYMWVFNGKKWVKTSEMMPVTEVGDLSEYAKHGYAPGERPKTVAELDKQVKGANGNVDGGNARTRYGGAPLADGGNSRTEV